jgi:hypothetical protein
MSRMRLTRAEGIAVADNLAILQNENKRLRAALVQFVAACDTAPPTSLMSEIGMACAVARATLSPAQRCEGK